MTSWPVDGQVILVAGFDSGAIQLWDVTTAARRELPPLSDVVADDDVAVGRNRDDYAPAPGNPSVG